MKRLKEIAQARCQGCILERLTGDPVAREHHTCHADLRDFQKAMLAVFNSTYLVHHMGCAARSSGQEDRCGCGLSALRAEIMALTEVK